MNSILMIITGIVIGIIFNVIYGKLKTKVTEEIKEKFSLKKFTSGMVDMGDTKSWAKDIVSLFNLRKLAIYLLIIGIIYGVGVYKGKMGKPVNVNLDYEKEFTLQLDGQTLHKAKNSTQLEVCNGNGCKTVTAGDIKELQKALKPVGIDIHSFFTAGLGSGDKHTGQEFGLGSQIFRYFKWHIDSFLTNRGIYLGVDYPLTDNFGILSGYGKGFSGDDRVYVGGIWKF